MDDNMAVSLPQSVGEAEQLVKRLYQPGHPKLIASINDHLQQLQRSPDGWKLADELLGSDDQTVRFYAALTFTVKLNNEGYSLDAETAQTVQSRLISWTVRLVQNGESKLVLKKLCSTLCTYFIRSPVLWHNPLLQLAISLQQGEVVHDMPIDQTTNMMAGALSSLSAQQVAVLLWFSATLAEEVLKVDSNTLGHTRLHKEMERVIQDATELMASSFRQSSTPGGSALKREALICYNSWVNYAQPIWPRHLEPLQYLRDLIPPALQCIYDEETSEEALEMFRDVLESYTSFFEPRHMDLITELIRNHIAPILKRAVPEKDETAEPYGRFVTAYGSANIKQVIEDSSEGRGSGVVVELVLDFLASDGYPGDDLFLAFGSVEFWNTYIEYVNDEIFSADPYGAEPPWARHAKQVMSRVVKLLWNKLWTPPNDVAKGWRDEEREMFKEYRTDAADLMLSIYVLLQNEMLSQLVNYTLTSLQAKEWRGVEASMFCLDNVADNVAEDQQSEDVVSPVFRSSLFREVADFSQFVPAQARRTAVELLGAYAGYIERHPEFLPDTVTFLFAALEKAGLANAAAKAIESLCSTCRVNLTDHLPGFLTQYQAFLGSPTCETYTKEKVIGAIAAIIQALRPESAKVQPLLALLENVEKDVVATKHYAEQGDDDMTELLGVSALECLASIGKGLQVPDDVPINLDDEENASSAQANYWTVGGGRVVQERIMGCFSILQVVGKYGEAIDAMCAILRCGFTEVDPGPFVLPPSVTVSFIQECSIETPQLEAVLSTVCTLITQHSRKDTQRVDGEVETIYGCIASFVQALGQPSQDPGVAMHCIEVLARMMPYYSHVLFRQLTPPVLDFTLAAMEGTNTFTKKSSCDFWTKMIKPHNSAAAKDVRERVQEVLAAYGPKFTNSLARQIGGNALRSDLEFLCEPLKALLLHQPSVQTWLYNAMLGATFPDVDASVGPEQKTIFVRQIITTRGDGNRIKVLVRQFWAACRGTVSSYGS